MIARIWGGETAEAQADAYFEYIMKTGVKGYRATEGNRGVWLLRRRQVDKMEFLLLSLWDSFEAIQRFAGEDVDRAVYYPEDEAYLLTLEPAVAHYDIITALGGIR
jgi:heme-degrading monooxygenase HmoA